MKRTPIIFLMAALSIMVSLSLMSCVTTSAGSTNGSQTTSTVTVTATSTSISTSTVTVTPAAKNTLTTPVPVSPTSTAVTNPAVSQIDSNNNGHFYLRTDISGYNKKLQPDGTYTQIPIYQEIFVDWRLGGFFTPKDAIFVPRIPTITDHDDWFFRFDNRNEFKPVWIINWGYFLKSNTQPTNVALYIFKNDFFNAYYYKNPSNLLPGTIGMDRGVSNNGIRALGMPDYGSYTVLIRTDNSDNVLGWWMKFGGE